MFKARLVISLFVLMLLGVLGAYALLSYETNRMTLASAPAVAEAMRDRALRSIAAADDAALAGLREAGRELARVEDQEPLAKRVAALGKKLDAGLLWWVDPAGVVRARAEDEKRSGDDVGAFPPVAAALGGATTREISVVAGRLLRVLSVPVLDPKTAAPAGVLVAGFSLDPAQLVGANAGGEKTLVALVLDAGLLVVSDDAKRPLFEQALAGMKDPAAKVWQPNETHRFSVVAEPFSFARPGRFSGLLLLAPLPPVWIAPFSEQTRLIVLGGLIFFVLGGLVSLITSYAVRHQATALAAQVQMVFDGQVPATKFNRRAFYAELYPLLDFVLKSAAPKSPDYMKNFPTLGQSGPSIPTLKGSVDDTGATRTSTGELTGSHSVMEELEAMVGRQTKEARRTPSSPTKVPEALVHKSAAPVQAPAAPAQPAAAPRTTLDLMAEDVKTTMATPNRPLTPAPAVQAAPRPAVTQAAMSIPMASNAAIPIIERPIPDDEDVYFAQVFSEYLNMRDRLKQPTHTVNRERFIENLKANAARIRQAKNCRKVRYTVFEKEGQAQVKATPIN